MTSFAHAHTVTASEKLAATLADELDRIIGRITRNDPIITVQDEGGRHWIVVDLANDPDAVMLRTPSVEVVKRWVVAFLRRHPEAKFQRSGEPTCGSDRPPGGTLPAASTGPVSLAEPHVEPESPEYSVKVPDLHLVQ